MEGGQWRDKVPRPWSHGGVQVYTSRHGGCDAGHRSERPIKLALLRDRQGRRTIESKVYMLRTPSVPLSLSLENRAPLTIPLPERQTQWDGGSMGQAASGAPTFPRVCQQLTQRPALRSSSRRVYIYKSITNQGTCCGGIFFYIEH